MAKVEIEEVDLEALLADASFLVSLIDHGVDNWDWYEAAQEAWEETYSYEEAKEKYVRR